MDLNPAFNDTLAFLRREVRLVIPLAFGTIGLGMLLLQLIMPLPDANGLIEPGPWMWWALPALLLSSIGRLAVAALKLSPGLSVGEALGVGIRRIGYWCLVNLMVAFVVFAVLMLVSAMMMAMMGAAAEVATVRALILSLPFLVFVMVRVTLVEPALANGGNSATPWRRAIQSIALTRGHFWRLLLILIASGFTYLLLLATVTLIGGSVFAIIGRAIGSPALAAMLTKVLISMFAAGFFAGTTVLFTSIYQRLANQGNVTGDVFR